MTIKSTRDLHLVWNTLMSFIVFVLIEGFEELTEKQTNREHIKEANIEFVVSQWIFLMSVIDIPEILN